MSLLRRVVKEYCDKNGTSANADTIEKDLRFAREMQPSKPLNKTISHLLAQYNKELRNER